MCAYMCTCVDAHGCLELELRGVVRCTAWVWGTKVRPSVRAVCLKSCYQESLKHVRRTDLWVLATTIMQVVHPLIAEHSHNSDCSFYLTSHFDFLFSKKCHLEQSSVSSLEEFYLPSFCPSPLKALNRSLGLMYSWSW